jgi:hypothetical protein
LKYLDWSIVSNKKLVVPFMKCLSKNYNGVSVSTPFFSALLAVRNLTETVVRQTYSIEDKARKLEAEFLSIKDKLSHSEQTETSIDFIDVNKLLGILASLDE